MIYAFLGDYFIFDSSLSTLQIVGVCVVLFFSIFMIIYNFNHDKGTVKAAVRDANDDLGKPESERAALHPMINCISKKEVTEKFSKGVKEMLRSMGRARKAAKKNDLEKNNTPKTEVHNV